MTEANAVTYTQLDIATRLGLVRTRIRELEMQHQSLKLRVEMPAPGEQITQNDNDNLQMLTNSIRDLHKLEEQLNSGSES